MKIEIFKHKVEKKKKWNEIKNTNSTTNQLRATRFKKKHQSLTVSGHCTKRRGCGGTEQHPGGQDQTPLPSFQAIAVRKTWQTWYTDTSVNRETYIRNAR